MRAALLSPALAGLLGCGLSPSRSVEVRQVMQDFTMSQTRAGEKVWTLASPEARITLEGEARLKDPEIMFFRKGRHASTARAAEATVAGEDQDVALRGRVVITAREEKTTLKCETLDFDTKEGMFRTDSEVLIENPGAKVSGRGLEADASLSEITIFKQRTVLR